MELEKVDKLLLIRDFITYLDDEDVHEPTTDDVDVYVAGCWYDIVNDDTIEDKQAFDKLMSQHLYNFIKFIKEN